ncbi:MAG: hypothetical protein R3C11_10310 [Planctomycetaceae bacterium]
MLIIASAGWVFDVYEGQIFNITRNQMLTDILTVEGSDPEVVAQTVKRHGDTFLAIFLLGGRLGDCCLARWQTVMVAVRL